MFKKFDEIPVPSNSPNDRKNNLNNTNVEEIIKDFLAGEIGSSGTK